VIVQYGQSSALHFLTQPGSCNYGGSLCPSLQISSLQPNEIWVLLQNGDTSEQATVNKKMNEAPVSAVSAAAENVKAFVAGGFGGICAVLVGSWARCTALSRFSLV
jgi:hypothetical protein